MNNNFIHVLNSRLLQLPTPVNISLRWNYGSLLGIFLIVQFIGGIILSIHYCPNITLAFIRIIRTAQNVGNNGWLIHNIRINGVSISFIFIYIHIGRGLYYHSFNLPYTWLRGVTIFILSIATAFLGYVLPWGQMSYWGAVTKLITNLTTAILYVGDNHYWMNRRRIFH